jgi:hypothetical protein
MYGIHTSTDEFYSINRTTGAATLIGATGTTSNPHGLGYDKDTSSMYLVDSATDNFYKMDLATGAANVIGPMGAGNLLGLAVIPDVPEPSSLGAIAVMGLVTLRRRR